MLWLEDAGYTDNNVSDHAGHSLIGVIDADQNMLGVGLTSTDEQIRDAAFSTVKQSFYLGDNHLDAVSLFDDSLDYSAPLQPQSGMVLQPLGLTMQVLSQSRNNSTAVIRLANANAITPLTVSFTKQVTQLAVNFTSNVDGGMGQLTYAWRFGDGATSTAEAPTHTYAAAGAYSVELTVTDMANTQVTSNATVTVAAATESSGGGSLAWLNLAILGVFAWSRQLKWR